MCQFIHEFRHQFRLSLSLIYNFLHFDSPLRLLIHLVSVEYVSKDGKNQPKYITQAAKQREDTFGRKAFFFSQ